MTSVPDRWKLPVSVLLRGLEEEGRQAPILEFDKDGSMSMGWDMGETMLVSLRDTVRLCIPAQNDAEHDRWVDLGADWVSDVRRLAPKKPKPYDDDATFASAPTRYAGRQARMEYIRSVLDLTSIEPVKCASDISLFCLEDMLNLLGEPATAIFTNSVSFLFTASKNRAHYDAALPGLMGATFSRSDVLDQDETLMIGATRAVYNPGA